MAWSPRTVSFSAPFPRTRRDATRRVPRCHVRPRPCTPDLTPARQLLSPGATPKYPGRRRRSAGAQRTAGSRRVALPHPHPHPHVRLRPPPARAVDSRGGAKPWGASVTSTRGRAQAQGNLFPVPCTSGDCWRMEEGLWKGLAVRRTTTLLTPGRKGSVAVDDDGTWQSSRRARPHER